MLKKKIIDVTAQPSLAQTEMLKKAARKPIRFDDDCPRLTNEQLMQFSRISEKGQAERTRKIASVSSQEAQKAKSPQKAIPY